MKYLAVLGACLLLLGCDYTVPLADTPTMERDDAIVGLWQRTTENGGTETLLVLPLAPREYLVSFPAEADDAMFARAWLCRVADRTFVQLRWFGTARAALPEDNRLYQYATYAVEGDTFTVRMLDTGIVSKDATTTAQLVGDLTSNADNPALFHEGMVFTRVQN